MTKPITSRSRFEVYYTTSMRDMGYDRPARPRTNAEIATAHESPDYRGTAKGCGRYLSDLARRMGSTSYRIVIRRCATGEFLDKTTLYMHAGGTL